MAEAAGSDVNRANYMPTGLNQRPAPGQQTPLSIQRVVSTIPKGDYEPAHQLEGSDTWTYPSPQMFYNAMRRKGYSPREGDMGNIVAIHNTVNERAWEKVMEWERMYSDRCPNPKLFKFKGLADDPSPKARVLSWAGYRPPFDRHDWIVDRCGTKQRYIIDFYNGFVCCPFPPLLFHCDYILVILTVPPPLPHPLLIRMHTGGLRSTGDRPCISMHALPLTVPERSSTV